VHIVSFFILLEALHSTDSSRAT